MNTEKTETRTHIGQSRSNAELGCFRIDLPVMSVDVESDERAERVILVEIFPDDEKTTAEDCGSYWHIRDWEITDVRGEPHWFCRHGYSIGKDMVAKLATMAESPNDKLRGAL